MTSPVVWGWEVRGVHVTQLGDLPQQTRLQLLAHLVDEMAAAAWRHYRYTASGTAAERQVAAVAAIVPDPPGVTAARRATLDEAAFVHRVGPGRPARIGA